MKWSWKGPLVLIGLVLLFIFVTGVVGGIQLLTHGVGWPAVAGTIAAGFLPLALFVGSGFVAAKVEEVIQRRKSKA